MTHWKTRVALTLAIAAAAASVVGWRRVSAQRFLEEAARAREQASAAIESGRPAEARAILEKISADNPRPDRETLRLLANAFSAEAQAEPAAKLWERIDREFPGHSWPAESLAARAALADLNKDHVVARDLYRQIVALHPTSEAASTARVGLLEIAYRMGDFEEARQRGAELLADGSLWGEARERAEQVVGEINLQLLYAPGGGPNDEIYTVERGDYVQKIAQSRGVTIEVLLKANNISDPRLLSVGQRLKIPKRDFQLIVDKSDNTLTVLAGGEFFKKYGCRTGREEHMTPVGEFKILNKKKDPDWRKPGSGEFVPAGSPDNELGTRWLAFQGSSLGIHGTIDPRTIGYYASQGCVGMTKEDVEELFDYIPVGAPLKIVGEQNPALRLPPLSQRG